MNAERLLEHYEKIAEAPDAVPKLRRFILDLAVRGKLVPQDPNDEPYRTRDTKTLKTAEAPFQVPTTWVWAHLSSLGKLRGGGTPSKANAEYWDGEIPWVSPKDMKVDYLYDAQLKISSAAIENSSTQLLIPESILFVVRGMILAHSFPVAISRVSLAINQDMKALELHDSKISEYLLRALKGLTPLVLRKVQRSSHGTCRLESADYATLAVPLPPLAEQQRIVAKVDELMGICDRLEGARKEREAIRDGFATSTLGRLSVADASTFRSDAKFAIEHLRELTTRPDQIKQLRQTILNLAVRGKLVPQDPNDEPASELLKRIRDDNPNKNIYPTLEALPPFPIPTSWVWTKLAALVLSSDAGWSPKTADRARTGDAWGILKVSAVSWDIFRGDENKQVLPGTEPRRQAKVNRGDFLISRANTAELIARAVIVEEQPINLMMSDKIVRLHLSNHINKKYLWVVNNYANYARDYYVKHATGVSASMKNVSRSVILNLAIPLPPLSEQKRIVVATERLSALCDGCLSALLGKTGRSNRLLERIIHKD